MSSRNTANVFPFAEADRSQQMRREHMQCQHCLKSKAFGAKLMVCSACKVAKYCGAECQRAAWPVHKATCKNNQLAIQHMDEQGYVDQVSLLRTWTSKHRPVLGQAALLALDLAIDESRAQNFVLLVLLDRKNKTVRPERAFSVNDVLVAPLVSTEESNDAFFPPGIVRQLRQHLQQVPDKCLCSVNNKHRRAMYCVVILPLDQRVPHVVPFGYCEAALRLVIPGAPWKEGLIAKLNYGVVS